MKRPLAIVALVYVAGILFAQFFHLPLFWLFLVCSGLTIAALVIPFTRATFLWPVIFFLGWTNFAFHTEIISPNDLRVQLTNGPELVSLRGKLSETPVQKVFQFDEKESWRTLAPIDVTEIKRRDNWQPAFGRVIVTTDGQLQTNFITGQEVEIFGVIEEPKLPIADGLFNYRTYLQRKEIHRQLRVESTNDWKIIGAIQPVPWSNRFIERAQEILGRGLEAQDQPLQLTWAMTLGWKTALTDEVSEPFMRSGTMHIFAISGLHIALIAGILVALLRVLQVPRGWCGVIVIPLIWFYTAATGFQASAIRSTIMMTIIVGGWALKRPSDLLNSLSAAAVIILLWNPLQLFQASFQLSFFVVLSLGLILPIFQKRIEIWLHPDPLLPPELRPKWQRWLDIPVRFTVMTLATSFAAWLGSVPLVAIYFHLFTPVSLIANFVIVPMAGLTLMSNLGSLICASWFPFATILFNHAGSFFMQGMLWASDWFSSRPFAFRYVPAPPIWACLIYYALLSMVLNGWLFKPRKRLVTISLLAIAIISIGWNWRAESRQVKITVLPLGGGDATFVDFSGRENDLLIDCGNENSFEFVVKPFLRAQGVNSLQSLLLTHGDLRHVGGTKVAKQNFPAKTILTSPAQSRSRAYREILAELRAHTNQWKMLYAGEQLGSWKILHPGATDKFPSADDVPLVLRGDVFGRTILFLSDLSRTGQNLLLERNGNLKADVVVSGIPRGSEPLNDALLDAIQPKLIVLTDTEFPATERASPKLRERLARRNARVIYCREAGSVTLNFSPENLEIKTAFPENISKTASIQRMND